MFAQSALLIIIVGARSVYRTYSNNFGIIIAINFAGQKEITDPEHCQGRQLGQFPCRKAIKYEILK